MMLHFDMSSKLREEDYTIRTPQIHKYHVKSVLENNDNRGIYGVSIPCAFSVLNGFEVTSSFPPDIMHDLLEGVIPQVLKLIFEQLLRDKVLSGEALET